MFNKLKHTKPMFFGEREVLSVDELENGRVKLHYKDFPGEANEEVMMKEEWEAGQSDKEVDTPQGRQEWFVKRTNSMRSKFALSLFSENPRYWDIPKILVWVGEGIKDAYGAAINMNFGVKDFDSEVSMDTVLKKVEDTGVDLYDGLNDLEKSFTDLIRKNDVKVWQLKNGVLFSKLTEKLTAHIDQAIRLSFGVDDRHLRTDDIENILKAYAEKNPAPVQSSDTGGQNGETPTPSAEPTSQDQISPETKSEEGKPEESAGGV